MLRRVAPLLILLICIGAGRAGPTSQPAAPLTVNTLFIDAPALPKNREPTNAERKKWLDWVEKSQIGKRVTVRGRSSGLMIPLKTPPSHFGLFVAGPIQSSDVLCKYVGVTLNNIDPKWWDYEEGTKITVRGDIIHLYVLPQPGAPLNPKTGRPFEVRMQLANVEFVSAEPPARDGGPPDMR